MVTGEALAATQLSGGTPTVLAPVAIARKQEGVGHLATKLAWHVNEPDQTDHRRPRDGEALAAEESSSLRFDDLSLAIDHETERPTNRHERERLERGVECEAASVWQHSRQIPPHDANGGDRRSV